MNEDTIKHLLKVGLYFDYDKLTPEDKTLQLFYMRGPNIVSKDKYRDLDKVLVPAIIYVPPEPDCNIDDYWSVAICTGPVCINNGDYNDGDYNDENDGDCDKTPRYVPEYITTTLTFSYRPWELRASQLKVNFGQIQIFTLMMVIGQILDDYVYPKEILNIIYDFTLLIDPEKYYIR